MVIVMKLKYFLQILSEFDVESSIDFDVKDVEGYLDFAHLVDCYFDGEALILEFR